MSPTRPGSICIALLLACALAGGSSAATPPAEIPPNTPCASDQCHAGLTKKKFVHGPVAAQECTSCHEQKGTRHEFTLAAKGNALCATCHDVPEKKKIIHAPVQEDCSACHTPHSSDVKGLLLSPQIELCALCHDEVARLVKEGKSNHSGAVGAEGCTACHAPHAGDVPKLLLTAGPALCRKCHDKAIKSGDRTLPGVKEELAGAKSVHPPAQEGDCPSCHTPHGSAHPALLSKPYPATFYAPYDSKTYELCFQCHDERLASEAQTKDATGFRNGSRNLHHAHVNKPVKGRTCLICHRSHASTQEKLIRPSVPFGPNKWSLPTQFSVTENGGRCASGCHVPLEYSRTPAAPAPISPPKP